MHGPMNVEIVELLAIQIPNYTKSAIVIHLLHFELNGCQ